MNEKQQICFTDSAGKALFSIPDNGILCLSYGNGDTHFSLCKFLDHTITSVGTHEEVRKENAYYRKAWEDYETARGITYQLEGGGQNESE